MNLTILTLLISVVLCLKRNNCRQPNCLICSENSKMENCKKCDEYYGLASNYCFKCVIENCLDCAGNPENCLKCSNFYFFDSLKQECVFCGNGCQECDQKENCINCAFLFKKSKKNSKNCVFDFRLFSIILVILFGPCVVVWILGCWVLRGRGNFKVMSLAGVEIAKRSRENEG